MVFMNFFAATICSIFTRALNGSDSLRGLSIYSFLPGDQNALGIFAYDKQVIMETMYELTGFIDPNEVSRSSLFFWKFWGLEISFIEMSPRKLSRFQKVRRFYRRARRIYRVGKFFYNLVGCIVCCCNWLCSKSTFFLCDFLLLFMWFSLVPRSLNEKWGKRKKLKHFFSFFRRTFVCVLHFFFLK